MGDHRRVTTVSGKDVMPGRRVARPPHKRSHSTIWAAVIAGILVVAAIGWAVHANVSGGDNKTTQAHGDAGAIGTDRTTSRSSSPASQGPSNGGEGKASSSARLLMTCAREVQNAERAISVARVGVSHWRAHVRARTDMLKGRISEKRMNAVWDRTRAAGPTDVRRFQTARRHYHEQPRCTKRHHFRPLPRSKRHAVTGCVTRSAMAPEVVAAAKATIVDWKNHLKHMNTYANGGMTAGKAQRLWVRAWRKAPQNIGAFHAAGAKMHHAPICPRSP
jgi:hypothetical protein